ncbi:hypothetical protein PR003_g28965 [Phytophthora rubi]|uniref:Uncharacterized protein n=1 Tax=Phytophthora rubi TaxID=129364 RepID=A0A6A4BVN2_9STRA|nr:hypothetical protein PR003_g28965 [Phytophthora rubi]
MVQAELLEQWPEVFVSPVGVVDKACADGPDIRLINDYSFPEGSSVNDFTDRTNWPEITYNPPGDIARRIFNLRRDHPRAQIMLMLGDVAGAFRHVPIHADHVHMFAFVIGDLLVIDLACGFGWCGSPAWYFVPGALINDSYEQGDPNAVLVPALAGSFWCDDHTCVEVNEGDRCAVANLTLRRAMATVLGPRAINERKFTQWGEQGRALGLLWDTQSGVVTMPLEKIEKAQNRLHDVLSAARVSKTSLQKLLGSLRHVATCCPPARAFYLRVQERASALGRWGHRRLDDPAQEDLKWFRAILQQHQRFNGVSVSTFAKLTLPIVHVHMDASGDGLCVLEPALKQYIRVQYTPEMKEDFTRNASLHSINVRELQSAVLGTLIWGPTWAQQHTERRAHVVFWIDNTSAVSWATRRASRQPLAQLYNRLLSLAEFQYSLVCSAEHVRGVHNVMADAGSRAWNKSHPLYATWTNLAAGWTQVQVRPPYDDLSALWARCSEDTPLLTLPQRSTEPIGNNGALSQSL